MMVAGGVLRSQMSSPVKLHETGGGVWSQRLFAAGMVIAVEAAATRSTVRLQEITFPPALPVDPPPRSPPATSYSTPKELPVMTLLSTLLPAPPLTNPSPAPPLFRIRFPEITWFVVASTSTP